MARWREHFECNIVVIKPFLSQGFIVPNLLTVEECDEVIQMGEDWGIGEEDFKVTKDERIRTSNRTNSYVNEKLTIR